MILCQKILQPIHRYAFKPIEMLSRRGIKETPKYIEKRIITQADVDQFTKLTGDTNPIHSVDAPEEKRCVHGAFLNAIVSGVIGTKLPGNGSIVLQQDFAFPHKCVCDEEITISVKIIENRHVKKIAYDCKQFDKVIFTGTANIVVRKI